MTDIAVINAATVPQVTDQAVQQCVNALQKQVAQHFQPIWGIGADLQFFTNADAQAGKIPPGYWWLAILDNSDQAGALGYHDITADGQPLGKAFAGTDIQYNEPWTITVSHELLEMLGDPDINLTVLVDNLTVGTQQYGTTLIAYEVCDACEADPYSYAIDGVQVSDFVTPAWFESFRQPNSAQFDYQNKVVQPFQLLPGGYIGALQVSATAGWQQITAQLAPGARAAVRRRARPKVGSRRERRRVPRNTWLPSQVGKANAAVAARLSKGITIA